MNKLRLLLSMVWLLALSPAFANEPYMEFQLSYLTAEVGDEELHPSMLSANFGYPVFKYMGVEIVLGAGLSGDEFKVKTLVGAYINASLPISYNFDIFARAGFSSVSWEYVTSGSDMGASFGLGLGLLVSENSSITFEFRTLPKLNDGEITLNAIMLGWKYK